MRLASYVSIITLAFGLNLRADTVQAGTPDVSGCIPFTCNIVTPPGFDYQYQQVYSSSLFSGAILINSLTFKNVFSIAQGSNDGPVLNGLYSVFLSTTQMQVNGLSSDLDSNVGPDYTEIFQGNLAQPINPAFTIAATTPFFYNPGSGNLLLSIYAFDQDYVPNTGLAGGYVDSDSTGSVTSRAYKTPFHLSSADEIGLVTTFDYNSVAPEPATFGLLAVGYLGILMSRRLFRS